ncbi:MAG: helix-turn-helix domain-containing protein [Chloroflexota bacterium]|mgnify:CR=1 FL=1|jgi:transposase-like protein
MSGKRGMKHYPVEKKLAAVQLYLEGGKTYREVGEILGVADPQRIEVWVRQYREEGTAGLSKAKGRPRKRSESLEEELKRLRMENDLLKKFQSELRKEARAKRNIGSSTTTEGTMK